GTSHSAGLARRIRPNSPVSRKSTQPPLFFWRGERSQGFIRRFRKSDLDSAAAHAIVRPLHIGSGRAKHETRGAAAATQRQSLFALGETRGARASNVTEE